MKLIFIRGLPGVGKTTVTNHLSKHLRSKTICVDEFKPKVEDEHWKNGLISSYNKAIRQLYSLYAKNKDNIIIIIINEMLNNKDFYKKLNRFVKETKSTVHWFRLMRPLKALLEIEAMRKRGVKNTKQDFVRLKKQVESIKIRDEQCIKNDNLELTIKKVLKVVGF